jgi:hypothetical protein
MPHRAPPPHRGLTLGRRQMSRLGKKVAGVPALRRCALDPEAARQRTLDPVSYANMFPLRAEGGLAGDHISA